MDARAPESLPVVPAATATAPVVRDGAILLYRLYDIAEEIDLQAAQARLSGLALPRRMRFARVPPKHIQIKNPPVAVSLGSVPLTVRGVDSAAEVTARVYDYGAISIAFSLPVADWPWARFEQVGRTVADAQEID